MPGHVRDTDASVLIRDVKRCRCVDLPGGLIGAITNDGGGRRKEANQDHLNEETIFVLLKLDPAESSFCNQSKVPAARQFG